MAQIVKAKKKEELIDYDKENEKNLRRNEIICYENLLDFANAKEKMASYAKDYPEDEEAQRENQFLQTR